MKKFLLTVFLCLFASSSWAADKVKLCQGNNFFSALSYIAQAKNYYQDEGLDVDISTTPLPKFCQDSLAAGRGDFIIISDAPLTYLAASGEAPIRILARLHTEKNIAVFARKDRGIQSPADLKGKKVAWLPGTPNQIYALRFLEKNHLKLEDIQMVVLQPQAMSQALIGGTIDAFIMFEPWGSNALSQLGDNGVKIYDPSIYPMQVTLQSSIDMAQNHPDLVAKMLRALIKSEKFIAEHHDEAISIIAAGTALDPKLTAQISSLSDYKIGMDDSLAALMSEDFGLLQKYDENFKDKQAPHFSSYIDPSVLKKIDPKRVTMP